MPQGSSAVRPTNGLYLLPYYEIFKKYASALRGIFSGVLIIAAFWEAWTFPCGNTLLPISLRFPERYCYSEVSEYSPFCPSGKSDVYECWALVEWFWQSKHWNTRGKKHVPLPNVHKKGAYGPTWDRTWSSRVTSVTNSLNHDTAREKCSYIPTAMQISSSLTKLF